MSACERIFSVSEIIRSSEGDPTRSVVLETEDSVIVVWHAHPGQEIVAHVHPHRQDTRNVLTGSADYYQGHGEVRKLKAGEVAGAKKGQVHGAGNTDKKQPFIFVSVVSPSNAGFVLNEK
jgi:quercetin dioxygenase-like cupin family protein